MDNSRQPPRVDVAKSEDGELARQSSLLPGEVRTPTMVVTLSEAWGDVSGDWAAPGSSVWEEEAPSRHSNQTPLTGYGREGDVWASATGSPLLGDDDGVNDVNAFAAAAAAQDAPHGGEDEDAEAHKAAALAAAALQAFAPHGGPVPATGAGVGALHADPQGLAGATMNPHAALLQQQQQQQLPPPPQQRGGLYNQPRYAPGVHYNYEGRFGTVHTAPTSDPIRGMQAVVAAHPPSPQLHQQQQQPNYFTVQDGGASRGGRAGPFTSAGGRSNYNSIPVMASDMNPNGAANAPGGAAALFGGPGVNSGVPFVPRLDDEDVAHSIIASAGLPLSMHSLVDYIHGGQPQASVHVSALGTTHNALRNYPNLNEPPTEEDGFNNNSNNNGGLRGGRVPQPSYMQQPPAPQQPGRWGQPNTAASDANSGGGFAVRGSDYSGASQHNSSPPPTFHHPASESSSSNTNNNNNSNGGGFVVSAGHGPVNPRISPHSIFNPTGHNSALAAANANRHKSESEYLSDLLHFHANFFPPPPPPRVPKEERRNRAELWYHYASKWDITHRLPPPPRTPLPEMEQEYRMRLQRMTRVPYHGDGWLQMGERWFDVTQTLFDFPEENVGEEVDFNVVLQQAVLS